MILVRTYRGYGQAETPEPPPVPSPSEQPTREDVLAAIAAAEAAAEESEKQYMLAQQQVGFNTQLVTTFVASAAFGIVAAALSTALVRAKEIVK